MNFKGKIFIDKKWIEASGTAMQSTNPANGETIWEGKSANENDVQLASEAARQAFKIWSQLSLEQRIMYLKAFEDQLKASKDNLAETISIEMGKPFWESKTEVAAMIGKIDISIKAYQERCQTVTNHTPSATSYTRHKPHGVVAVFGPFNFPGHLPNGHIIPALLAGNTVIFKPSEQTPLVAEKTIELWEKSGLPPGVINLIQGGAETGKILSNNAELDGIFFTGSYAVGQSLATKFAGQPNKILALEMGGNNPLVIGRVTDLQAASYLIVQSAFLTSGQRCTCARRLIIPEGKIGDLLIEELIKMSQSLKIGSFLNKPEPFMGPVVNEKTAQHLMQVQDNLKIKGGIALLEMKHLQRNTGFISPGIMDVTPIIEKNDEEIFGPFLQLIRVKNFETAIEEANKTQFGLSAGLLSDKKDDYQIFYRDIKAGIVNWNQPTTGASSAAPFGGIRKSGNHRPSAFYASDYCSYPIASLENEGLQMPNTITPGVIV